MKIFQYHLNHITIESYLVIKVLRTMIDRTSGDSKPLVLKNILQLYIVIIIIDFKLSRVSKILYLPLNFCAFKHRVP